MAAEALVQRAPTARKAMMAKQEELGDLKLYRIPEPVTVAARAPMKDAAVGEEVEIAAGSSPQVQWSTLPTRGGRVLTLANANPRAVTVEVAFDVEDGKRLIGGAAKLPKKDGRPLWRISVPANGKAELLYGLR
jgi:hypothetical protein